MLDKAAIAECLPHTGDMLLLETINYVDENRIEATAIIDTKKTNPLMSEGRLGCWNLIEYGAQAAAVHLTQKAVSMGNTNRPKGGYLMQVKSAEIKRRRIGDGVIVLTATCISSLPAAAMYQLKVREQTEVLLTADITFALNQ